jgi:hypothetical protein
LVTAVFLKARQFHAYFTLGAGANPGRAKGYFPSV